MTTTAVPLCECGHVHESVVQEGVEWAFHRCRAKGCACDQFRPAQPAPARDDAAALVREDELAANTVHLRERIAQLLADAEQQEDERDRLIRERDEARAREGELEREVRALRSEFWKATGRPAESGAEVGRG